jgi:glucose/arabinose dehydrogenase
MRRLLVLAGLAVLVLAAAGLAQPSDEGFEAETVVDDLGAPVDLAIAPAGDLWWNAIGESHVVRHGPDTGEQEIVLETEAIHTHAERGLVGLALDPDVADNGVFYVFYTLEDPNDPEGGTNVLERVEDGERTRLLTLPAHVNHNGGRIVFDEQGRMFVSTGDNQDPVRARPEDPLGSILHMHPNGTPTDETIANYSYSIGHRNVFGLAYDEANDRLFATENSNEERDEVNLIEAGQNYGWPECQGHHRYDAANYTAVEAPCTDPDYTDPIGVFYDNDTAAPTGAAVLDGDLYWGSFNEGTIHRLTQDPETGDWNDTVVHDGEASVFDVEAHEGSIYYAERGAIGRLDPPDPASPGGLVSEVPTPGALAALAFALSAMA